MRFLYTHIATSTFTCSCFEKKIRTCLNVRKQERNVVGQELTNRRKKHTN